MHSAAIPPAGFAFVYFPQNESGEFQVLLSAHPLPYHVIAISRSSAELMIWQRFACKHMGASAHMETLHYIGRAVLKAGVKWDLE